MPTSKLAAVKLEEKRFTAHIICIELTYRSTANGQLNDGKGSSHALALSHHACDTITY